MMVLTNRMMVLIIRCRFKVDYCFPIFSSSDLVYYLMSKWQLRPSAFFYRINFMHMTTSVSQIINIICITVHVRGQHSEKRRISILKKYYQDVVFLKKTFVSFGNIIYMISRLKWFFRLIITSDYDFDKNHCALSMYLLYNNQKNETLW